MNCNPTPDRSKDILKLAQDLESTQAVRDAIDQGLGELAKYKPMMASSIRSDVALTTDHGMLCFILGSIVGTVCAERDLAKGKS